MFFFVFNFILRAIRAKQLMTAGEITQEGATILSRMSPLFIQKFQSFIDFAVCSIAGEKTLLQLVDCLAKVKIFFQIFLIL